MTNISLDVLKGARDMRLRGQLADLYDGYTASIPAPDPDPPPQPMQPQTSAYDEMLTPFQDLVAKNSPQGAPASPVINNDPYDAMLEPFRANVKPSPYAGALTTLGGTDESEALTQPGGAAYVAGSRPSAAAGAPLAAMSGAYDQSHQGKLVRIGQVARATGLDDEGARILQAVATTEGGLGGAIGDQGQSRGPYQFYEGGQMPAFRSWLKAQGIQGDPNTLVNDVDLATRFAASTYLGDAIRRGRAKGLSGDKLATYVQETGQVSVDPWKTGDNYRALFGGGKDPFAVQPTPAQQSAPPSYQPNAPVRGDAITEETVPTISQAEPDARSGATDGAYVPGGLGRPAGFNTSAYGRLDSVLSQQPVNDQSPAPLEPGDFQIPGYNVSGDVPPDDGATSFATEPPTDAAADSLGGAPDVQVESPPQDPWARVGNAIRDALGFGEKSDLSQGAADIQQRQATMPGTPEADALAAQPMPISMDATEALAAAPQTVPSLAPVQRREFTPRVADSGPLVRDQYYNEPQVQQDVLQPRMSPDTSALTGTEIQAQADENAQRAFPMPEDLARGAGRVAESFTPKGDEIARVSRGEAVNPFAYGSTLGYGVAEALPSEVKQARVGPITGRDVAASVLDPSTIAGGPFDLLGLGAGAAIAGGLKQVGKSAAGKAAREGAQHVLGAGYLKDIPEDQLPVVRRIFDRARQIPDGVSRQEIADFAQTEDFAKAAGFKNVDELQKFWATQDTRLGAAQAQVLREGAGAAVQELLENGTRVAMVDDPGLRQDFLDNMEDIVVGLAAIRGERNAASYAGRMLNQFKHVTNVRDSQAWLESMKQFDSEIADAEKILRKRASGKKISDTEADAVNRAADSIARRAQRGTFSEEGDSITRQQIKNLDELTNRNKNPILNSLDKLWDDMASAYGTRKIDTAMQEGVPLTEREFAWGVIEKKLPGPMSLEKQVAYREAMKRQIDDKIQKIINRERVAETREEVRSMAKAARAKIDEIIQSRTRVKMDSGDLKVSVPDPEEFAQLDAALREDLDFMLRSMRDHSNIGAKVADEVQSAFDSRLDKWVELSQRQTDASIAKMEDRKNKAAQRFIEDIDKRIAERAKRRASDAATEKMRGLREQADSLIRQINTDPENADLRQQFNAVVRDINNADAGGAEVAARYYTREELQDTADILRRSVSAVRAHGASDPDELISMATDAYRRLGELGAEGQKRQKNMSRMLIQQGLQRVLGDKKVTDEEAAGLWAALGTINPDDPKSLGRALATLKMGSGLDAVITMSTLNMLTNPKTHATNIISTGLQGASRFGIQLPLMALHDTLRHGGETINRGDLGQAYQGLVQGMGAGLQLAGEMLAHGYTGQQARKAAQLADISGVQGEALAERFGWPGKLLHMISSRPLAAGDIFFNSMFYGAERGLLLSREARQTGKSFGELLDDPRVVLRISEEAQKRSDYTLLRSPSYTKHGMAAVERELRKNLGDEAAGTWKFAMHTLMPFTTTPENVLRQGARASGLGAAVQAWRYKGLAGDPEAQAKAFSDVVTGSALGAASWWLYMSGGVTGQGPDSPSAYNMWAAEGPGRNMMKNPADGKWYSYDNTPWAIPMSSIVTAMERYREALANAESKGAQRPIAEAVKGAVSGGVGSFLSLAFVKNAADIYDSMRRGDANADGLVPNLAGRAIPAASGVAFLARLGDDMSRETRMVDQSFLGEAALRARIPTVKVGDQVIVPGSTTLPPRLNVIGEPVKQSQNVGFVGPTIGRDPSQAAVAFNDAGLGVGQPPTSITRKGVTIQLSPSDRYQWLDARGQAVSASVRALKKVVPGFDGLSEFARNEILGNITDEANERAYKAIQADADMIPKTREAVARFKQKVTR